MKTLKQMQDLVQVVFDSEKHLFHVYVKTTFCNYHWKVTVNSDPLIWSACRRLEFVVLRSWSSNKVLYSYNVRRAINMILSYYHLVYLWEK